MGSTANEVNEDDPGSDEIPMALDDTPMIEPNRSDRCTGEVEESVPELIAVKAPLEGV